MEPNVVVRLAVFQKRRYVPVNHHQFPAGQVEAVPRLDQYLSILGLCLIRAVYEFTQYTARTFAAAVANIGRTG